MNIVRIASGLYNVLLEKGGLKLVSVYCTIKFHKRGRLKYFAYASKNNKRVQEYTLLSKESDISLNTLKKYVPALIELGLLWFDKGDAVLLGNEKCKKLFKSKKLVPIKIGKNIINTQYNVLSVKLHSECRQQKSMIKKKLNRSELKFSDYDKPVLSNQGYAVLKDGSINNKSKGAYWKSRLIKNCIVIAERNIRYIRKMIFSEYIKLKNTRQSFKFRYSKGWLVEEFISYMTPVNLAVKRT